MKCITNWFVYGCYINKINIYMDSYTCISNESMVIYIIFIYKSILWHQTLTPIICVTWVLSGLEFETPGLGNTDGADKSK